MNPTREQMADASTIISSLLSAAIKHEIVNDTMDVRDFLGRQWGDFERDPERFLLSFAYILLARA